MNISKKNLIVIVAVAVIVSAVFGYELAPQVVTLRQKNAQLRDNVFIVYELFEGKAEYGVHNVITDIGENLTRVRHSRNQSATDYALNWISIGNVTGTLQTKTQLDTEYLRKLGTPVEWTNSGDYAMNCTYKFEFTETKKIDGAGLQWGSTGDGNLYAVANFVGGAQTFNNGENLTVRWVVTYDAND